MEALVRTAMEEGRARRRVGADLSPGSFAETDELIALAEVAAEYDGIYISHVRGEGAHLLEAVGELHHHRPRSRHSGRDLPLQGVRREELAAVPEGRGARGTGSGRGPPDHRRRLHLPRQLHRSQRRPCRRGCRREVSTPRSNGSRTRPSADGSLARCSRNRTTGRTGISAPDRPTISSWSVSRARSSNH